MKKSFFLLSIIYFFTIFILLMAVYQFLKNWHMSEFNFFIAGFLVFLVAMGWGYLLILLVIEPKKKMEEILLMLTKDIIHELNIPLATIEANSKMLSKHIEDKKSLKRLQRIDNASLRVKKLYNELVYTLNKELHTIEKECFNIKPLILERIQNFEAQNRNPFVVEMRDCEINADKIGFEQMLDNILTNAMKYSSKEKPIRISLEDNVLSIKDEGVGMSTSELLRVYERYFQANKSKKGEGIGLSLVHTYCENAEIIIRIVSEKNTGTVVYFNLEKIKI